MTEFITSSAGDLKTTTSSLDGTANLASPSHRHHVDLFNFDDPRFENYRYVLTSPRSIEACQRLGVKPVALLPKSFARFQDEMKTSGLDIRELYDRFLEVEKKRLELVELCREERKKVVDEEINRQHDNVEGLSRSVSMDMVQPVQDKSVTFSNVNSNNTGYGGSTLDKIKRSTTTILPNKPKRGGSAGLKLAANFGLGIPANYDNEQQALGAEADKARYLAEARAQHSNRLAALKKQLEDLELETRMLRLNESKPGSSAGGRAALRKSSGLPKSSGNNTVDDTWLIAEMKKQVEFNDEDQRLSRSTLNSSGQKPPRQRAQSAGIRSFSKEIVSGVGLMKKQPPTDASPLRQMVASHVDDMQRQVENQRALMEQSQMVDEWRQLIAERKKAEEAQARARRRRIMLEKKLKSQQERLEKQLAQRGNLRRLEEEEQAYRDMLRTSITSKDRRTEELLRTRDEEVERSRTISRMSEKLREDMRRSVNADSFDKKVQRVHLENAVGHGPRTHLTNVSKLKLG